MNADEMRAALHRMGIAPDKAELTIAGHFRTAVEQRGTHRQRDNAPSEVSSPRPRPARPSEKHEEEAIDKHALARGAFVYRLSQARETNQTPGLPDRYIVWPDIAVWWEVKSATGVASQAQVRFAQQCAANGTPYGIGTAADFLDWCRLHRKAPR